ncbi:hypothetical protein C4D60_Mb10t12860 [Musa balbisiana]|uniref:Uncharacterized protein n=1 Tax=Musa balbisiana TaxID=52838 RepID=A0A4S8IXJ8_MUSBA|nr:hypothetical protein C4D60_Mb10t12860 [Musa balbisiana]
MAVRAQYPANAFSPDFRYRARSGALDDPLMMQEPRDLLQLHGNNLVTGEQQHQILNNAGVFSDRQSELTCNASGCRKRSREESMALPGLHNPALSTLFRYPNATAVPVKPTAAKDSVGLPHSRSIESGATSTSGRHVSSSHAAPPPPCDLVSLLFQQNTEIDALVRLQVFGSSCIPEMRWGGTNGRYFSETRNCGAHESVCRKGWVIGGVVVICQAYDGANTL